MASFEPNQFDDVSIATIRTLAADVVGKAKSGHPGKLLSINLACRTIMATLFRRTDGNGSSSPCPLHSVLAPVLLFGHC
jgi:transketolase